MSTAPYVIDETVEQPPTNVISAETIFTPKKANHQANVVVIGADIFPHTNADSLELIKIDGFQVVVRKGQFAIGDVGVYIQPDSIVPQSPAFEFIWKDYVGVDGSVPERRRRITVRRFRKEYSEGLLLPLSDFPEINPGLVSAGDDLSDLLGISHYVPEADKENTYADIAARPKFRYPKTLKGWFWFVLTKLGIRSATRSLAMSTGFDSPYYDVDSLKNFPGTLRDDETVSVSEKIHGSNARYVSVDGVLYCGSRTQWKRDGANVWWNAARQHPEIEQWCHENPNLFLYGEVGPTQKGFRYGCLDGETFFFGFDVWDRAAQQWIWPGNLGFSLNAPVLYVGPYDDAVVKAYADGDTVVPGAGKQIREGVVISSLERRRKLKVVSNAFYEKDSK